MGYFTTFDIVAFNISICGILRWNTGWDEKNPHLHDNTNPTFGVLSPHY